MSMTLDGVGHRFGDRPWLFRNLDVTLHRGRAVAVVGPSGSGKSTLLGLLAGWISPTEGEISGRAASVAWVFQNPTGAPGRRAVDLVAYPYLTRGHTIAESQRRAREGMARLGLEAVADRPFRSLSGGEAQRLMLARAMSIRPGLLLIDEPTAQLDRQTAMTVNVAITELASEGIVTVIATHDVGTQMACTEVIDLGAFTDRGRDAPVRHPE